MPGGVSTPTVTRCPNAVHSPSVPAPPGASAPGLSDIQGPTALVGKAFIFVTVLTGNAMLAGLNVFPGDWEVEWDVPVCGHLVYKGRG